MASFFLSLNARNFEPPASVAERSRNLEPEDLTPAERKAIQRLARRTHVMAGAGFRPRGIARIAGVAMRPATAARLIGHGLASFDAGRLTASPDGKAMARKMNKAARARR